MSSSYYLYHNIQIDFAKMPPLSFLKTFYHEKHVNSTSHLFLSLKYSHKWCECSEMYKQHKRKHHTCRHSTVYARKANLLGPMSAFIQPKYSYTLRYNLELQHFIFFYFRSVEIKGRRWKIKGLSNSNEISSKYSIFFPSFSSCLECMLFACNDMEVNIVILVSVHCCAELAVI